MRKRILFRFSGGKASGKELGLGHVYRSLNIAEYFKKEELFFLIEDFGGIYNLIKNRGFTNIIKIKPDSKIENDLKISSNIIKNKKIDLIIIDKYKISFDYLNKIRKLTKSVYISDLYKVNLPADMIVNGFIGFENQTMINKYGSLCLLGPRYQILHKNFKKKKKMKKHADLLVTFGGFDENKLIDLFLKNMQFLKNDISIRLILGPSTKNSKRFMKYQKQHDKKITFIKETNDMAKEIIQAKYGLCSGGITSYEFAAMKIPFAIICQVRHQLQTAKVWESLGIAKNLGFNNKSNSLKIKKFLDSINKSNSLLKSHNIIDGNGAKRVAKEIEKLL